LAWLVCRTLIYTVVTYLSLPNVALDTVEMLYWGRQWQWGYGKHPPLPAWLAETAWWLCGGHVIGVHLLGYALTGLTIWAVWRLARRLVPPREALLAALSLEGVLFYTYWTYDFNNNVVLVPCWALTTLTLFRACQRDRVRDWLATGAWAGLGLLAKYSLVFLLVPLLVWMLLEPQARRYWRRPGPYLALAVMLLIVAPHVAWTAQHDWVTLSYVSGRANKPAATIATYLLNPLIFVAFQVFVLLPLLVVLALTLVRRPEWHRPGSRFAGGFLATVVLGPVGLHVALALIMGAKLCAGWGAPLWTCAGLALIRWRPPAAKLQRWLVVGLVACSLAGLALVPIQTIGFRAGWYRPQRFHYPGRTLAREADRHWREHYPGPIPAVAGSNWLAGNIGLYAPGRPQVCFSADTGDTFPWVTYTTAADDAVFRSRGGIVVWESPEQEATLPPQLAERFPNARPPITLHLGDRLAPVGLAIVPPAQGNF
jgi:4-amino-4-deoxy-L-arabinose transferase-like glycosyltransferase